MLIYFMELLLTYIYLNTLSLIISVGLCILRSNYSADKDPELRHCSMENSKINGVEWYANPWLDHCAMTGGASGGGVDSGYGQCRRGDVDWC